MSRSERHAIVDRFAQPDFNEQLYGALRQSPWWMMSLAFHVLVFFVGSLFVTSVAPPPEADVLRVPPNVTDVLPPPEPDPENPPEDEPIYSHDAENSDPVIKDAPLAERVETDVDLNFAESFGQGDGISAAPFDGMGTNALVGIGGGGGGSFKGRGSDKDTRIGGRRGGTKQTEDAVEHALEWLAAHQSPDGRWEAAGFDQWCNGKPAPESSRPDGLGKALYDPGVTGLALCAFLGAGYTNRGTHRFSKVVGRGLRFLKNVQDPEGCFGPRATQHFIYNHATAALAMVEAFGMTNSPQLKGPAQRALDFIAIARNPYFAWRYGVKPGDNDTSVTGWMMMAMKSAKLINEGAKASGKERPLELDEEAFDGVRSWVDKMTDPEYGRVGYIQRGQGPARPQELVDRFPGEKSESMTAVGVLARVFTGEDPRKSEPIQKGAQLMLAHLPVWNPTDGSIDQYYWYYATLAMFQVGGDGWTKWNDAMKTSMVATQRMDGEYCLYKGSWDPIDPWGGDGGRVYSTALLAMCLEVYYRYDRVIGTR